MDWESLLKVDNADRKFFDDIAEQQQNRLQRRESVQSLLDSVLTYMDPGDGGDVAGEERQDPIVPERDNDGTQQQDTGDDTERGSAVS